ncbi:toxin [Streptomyces albiflavescens]|uniref:Toxin n=1 Tax=Streptomyces albiflavescens TaxID=1623582 RepID=A0A917YBR1_9ACTN|nr:SRPBCC family protein [Streptomyces albiflavescens]GGN81148.1 toxin [Streptomyces albiflavescens]
MYATHVSRRVKAAPAAVYQALIDPDAVAAWRVPAGMTSHVHAFDPREGGTFRVSLTYDDAAGSGKSDAHTDTYRGHFARLVPNELVVEVIEFETSDDQLRGTMTMTTSLTQVGDATDVVIVHEGIPDDVPRRDNELGTRMALDNLARLVEGS